MYERGCPQQLDERMTIWKGLEWEEIVGGFVGGALVGLASMAVVGFLGILLGFLAGAAVLSLFRAVHSGKPGYLFSRLYRAGLWSVLPAPIRPKYLIPIPLGIVRGRIRLSPVPNSDQEEGRRLAHLYFGR